jgi:integrase
MGQEDITMRRLKHAGGRLYRRKSRCTGKKLSTWTMVFLVDGKEKRESTGETDLEAAQEKLRKRFGDVNAGTYTEPDLEGVTVADILDRVRGHYDLKGHRSGDTLQAHIATWTTALGKSRLALDITTTTVQRVVALWKATGYSAATCNRRLAILRRAYRLAKLRLDPARLDFVDLFQTEEGPTGKYMPPDVFTKIHGKLPAHIQPFFEFSYLTGVRKKQLAQTTVAHVNTSTWTITWPKTEVKAKRDHVIALDGRVLEIVQGQLAGRPLHCRHPFHGRGCSPGHQPSKRYACIGDFKKAWRTAVEAAGFTVGRANGYVWHNTRHSAVTILTNAGVPRHEAKTVSGHTTDEVFNRYSIGIEQQQRAALRAVTLYKEQFAAERTVVPLRSRRHASADA